MTIGTDHQTNPTKRPIEEAESSVPKKRKKTKKEDQQEKCLPEVNLPFQKMFDQIIIKCCSPNIDFHDRENFFFVAYLNHQNCDNFIFSILHAIYQYPTYWTPLAECITSVEEYASLKQNLVSILNGDYDQKYLRTIGQHTEIHFKNLETQRLRFLGTMIGQLLEKLPEEIQQQVPFDDHCPTFSGLVTFSDWFQLFRSLPHNAPAVSHLVTEHRKALDGLLLIDKRYLFSVPQAVRPILWQINQPLPDLLANVPAGRRYLLSVMEQYTLNDRQYAAKEFFIFLRKHSSAIRNSLNDSLISKPWFKEFVKRWVPETVELLTHTRIPVPDIQYNAPWKKNVRSLMQPLSMRALNSSQKKIFSWSLFFADDIREFWHYLSKNQCLIAYLSKLDIVSLKDSTEQQTGLLEELILSRSLSNQSNPQLNRQISELTEIFSDLRNQYIPNLFYRLAQYLLKGTHDLPKYKFGGSFPLKEKHYKTVVEREYRLMDSLFKVLFSTYGSNTFYQDAAKELSKIWKIYDFEQKVSFTIHFIEKCLEYYGSTDESYSFFLGFIDALEHDEDVDLVIQILWDEGLLHEEFGLAILSGFNILTHPNGANKLFRAISRNSDKDEIFESLNLRTIVFSFRTG